MCMALCKELKKRDKNVVNKQHLSCLFISNGGSLGQFQVNQVCVRTRYKSNFFKGPKMFLLQ